MEFPICILLLTFFALYNQNGANAEYCKRYPGDISFSYTTTQDEYYWFQNYKNAYTGKKANGGAYTIYRRRTVITRRQRPGGHSNVFNSMKNVNDIQIQQVQQQVQQGPSPFMKVEPTEEKHLNETEEEEEAKPLPIWKITIPRQTSRAVIARIEDGKVVDHFELNSTHFQNTNVTTESSVSSSQSFSAIASTSSQYTRVIDITDQSIIADAWYAVCLDVNIVEKSKPHTCNHCTLIKARTDSSRQKFLDFDWDQSSFRNNSADVRFSAVDLPFTWATIRSKVISKHAHPRCVSEGEKLVFESKDFAYPEHFTYLTVRGITGARAYTVRVDVDFPWKEEPKGVLPSPFMALDYLYSDSSSTILAKCDDYTYKDEE